MYKKTNPLKDVDFNFQNTHKIFNWLDLYNKPKVTSPGVFLVQFVVKSV